MIFPAIVLAVAVAVGASAAHAQALLDIKDPAITKKPTLAPKQTSYPDYPSSARRANQQGETRIRTCVELSGRTQSTTLVSSSGYDALDQAALAWTSDVALFVPAEASGKPTAVCNYEFTYVWSLPQRNKAKQDSIADFIEYSSMIDSYRPKIVSKAAQSAYPESSRAAGVSGPVKVELCIGAEGQVAALYSDPVGGDDALVKATLGMALISTYAPGRRGTKTAMVCGLPFEHTWVLPE